MRIRNSLYATLVSIALVAVGACSKPAAGGDLTSPPPDAALPASDAAGPPDLGCTTDLGPGCCYPACRPDEALVCLGDNICGYPCHCEPRRDGFTAPDLGCVPNRGPGCCYPTCLPGQVLSCVGANLCGYPCTCAPGNDGGRG